MNVKNEVSKVGNESKAEVISGDISFPIHWVVFAPLERTDPVLGTEILRTIPTEIIMGGKTLTARTVQPERGVVDLRSFFNPARTTECNDPDQSGTIVGMTAYVFVPLVADKAMDVTLGMGCDHWLQAWVNGEPILGGAEVEDDTYPPTIRDFTATVRLKKGENVLAVRFGSGRASSLLALGGPQELLGDDFGSPLSDPFNYDPRWRREELNARPGVKPVLEIGSRRELFVDDCLIDSLTGTAERRLHHPTPREVVFSSGLDINPWEFSSCNFEMIQEEGRIRLLYTGVPAEGQEENLDEEYRRICRLSGKGKGRIMREGEINFNVCVAESADGIHFARPELGLHEYRGSKRNNIIGFSQTPCLRNYFLDPNPNAPEGQRFKCSQTVPDNGLYVYGSPDRVHWRKLVDSPIVTIIESHYGLDGQNDAFWDPVRNQYMLYFRDCSGGLRNIGTCTSSDFINWTKPVLVTYKDDRQEHMYTHNIRPYFRAPHIYIGTPNRFVQLRTKFRSSGAGINDAILMSSRDGLLYERWEEGFIRAVEPDAWTNRNNYVPMGQGMFQTSPNEISIYWSEGSETPIKRLRRGTIRLDGFVSLHAGGLDVGEMLTRPLVFSGANLEVNYATSAVGTLRFALCDEQGKPFKGYSLEDSEVLFGNEIEHQVRWPGAGNLAALAGKPVRLRVRLHDADLYSFRFA